MAQILNLEDLGRLYRFDESAFTHQGKVFAATTIL